MKAKLLAVFVLAALLVTAATAAAEEIDSVILTTKTHYPDTIIAGAVGNHIGSPVFVTTQNRLDSEVLAEIESLSPATVYIIGGPAAISDDVEASLAEDYDVVRIWGMTRYGTAAELAQYFWESSEKAMLVWDVLGLADAGNYEMLAEARDLAIQEDIPVLLISRNEIPEQVVDALVNLSVQSVVLVGNVGDDVTGTLDELGIEIEDHIAGADRNKTTEMVREKVRERMRQRAQKHMVIVATGNWSDCIKAPYMTNGSVRHITGEDQIDNLIAEIEEMNYTSIKIVGNPELAMTIYDRLTEAGIDADLITGRDVASSSVWLMKKELSWIKMRADAMRDRLRDMYQRKAQYQQKDADRLVERTRMFISQSGLSEELKTRWLNWLSEKKDNFDSNMQDGNYREAMGDFNSIKDTIKAKTLEYRERLSNVYHSLIRQETTLQTALRERINSLRESIVSD